MRTATNYDVGPCVGNVLNVCFFPGLEEYKDGQYRFALEQMNRFLERPQYTSQNPKQAEYHSLGHYIRGMIYLYHAQGLGRHQLAIKDFLESIRWSPKSYSSYFELSQAYAELGLYTDAIETIERLISVEPDPATRQDATKRLETLRSGPR